VGLLLTFAIIFASSRCTKLRAGRKARLARPDQGLVGETGEDTDPDGTSWLATWLILVVDIYLIEIGESHILVVVCPTKEITIFHAT
jgi:hypothetical protein